jgi:hypothetical protein
MLRIERMKLIRKKILMTMAYSTRTDLRSATINLTLGTSVVKNLFLTIKVGTSW